MTGTGRVLSCHCGRPVHTYEDGFTRDMCESCSTYRCDIEPNCPHAVPGDEGRRQTSDVVCRVCGTEYEFAENAQWCGHPGTSGDARSPRCEGGCIHEFGPDDCQAYDVPCIDKTAIDPASSGGAE